MPSLNPEQAITLMASIIQHNPAQAIHLSGPPGVGKTSLNYQAAERAGLPSHRVLLLRPTLMDPVDLLGTPRITPEGATAFAPPANLLAFREGTGPGLIIIDELPQCGVAMQNALGGLLLEGLIGSLRLDKQVARISTGNRVEDKAGAIRPLSQIANRYMHIQIEVGVDEWSAWAMRNGIDPQLVAFFRLRPALLHDFDPDRQENATPRSWEMVSRIPTDLPEHLYAAAVCGLVGDGPGNEWVGTRKIMSKMPSIDGILAAPSDYELPSDPVVKYAVASSLANRANARTFDAAMTYMARMPPEFTVLFISLVKARDESLLEGPAFGAWSVDNLGLLL